MSMVTKLGLQHETMCRSLPTFSLSLSLSRSLPSSILLCSLSPFTLPKLNFCHSTITQAPSLYRISLAK